MGKHHGSDTFFCPSTATVEQTLHFYPLKKHCFGGTPPRPLLKCQLRLWAVGTHKLCHRHIVVLASSTAPLTPPPSPHCLCQKRGRTLPSAAAILCGQCAVLLMLDWNWQQCRWGAKGKHRLFIFLKCPNKKTAKGYFKNWFNDSCSRNSFVFPYPHIEQVSHMFTFLSFRC